MIDADALEEFKNIYRITCGKEISNKKAIDLSTQLNRLYKAVLFDDDEKSKLPKLSGVINEY